ncbi:unnamed protein product [Ixodes hexagonus]
MAVQHGASDVDSNINQDSSLGGESSQCRACRSTWKSFSEHASQTTVQEKASPVTPGPVPPFVARHPDARIFLNALPISMISCTAVFCVAMALVVMLSLALVLQVYTTRDNSYHDTFVIRTDDEEDSSNGNHPPSSYRPPPKERTLSWKIKLAHGSRPPVASRRSYIYWPTRQVPAPSDPDYEKKPIGPTTTRPQIIRDFPLLRARDYMGRRKCVCMFHAAESGRMRNGMRYKAWTFPYHLCTHLVYCCAGISRELEITSKHIDVDIDEGSLATFASMKERNPHLRIYIGVGGEEKDSESFSQIAFSGGARQQFAEAAVAWMQRFRYDGIMLYWKFAFLDQKDRLVDTMACLRRILLDANLTAGLVLPLNELLRDRFDIPKLARFLDDYTILIDPTEAGGVATDATFVPFRDSTIRKYAGLFLSTLERVNGQMRDGRFKLCYLLPVRAMSLTLEEEVQTEIGAPVSGPGEPGVSTDQPGFLSYDEVCQERWDQTRGVNYGVVGTKANQWVVFQNRSSLRELITQLGLVTGSAKCLGVWDPSWDDFSGFCGEGAYPLTRIIFSKVIGRRIAPPTTPKASYVL